MLAADGIDATISGSLSVAGATATLGGDYEATNSGDAHVRLTATTAGGMQVVTSLLNSGGKSYAASGDGPWVTQPEPVGTGATGENIDTVVSAVTSVTDEGVVSRNGQPLHHLSPPVGTVVDPAEFGFTGPSFRQTKTSLDFYAQSDGTPAVIVIDASWKQKTGTGSIPASVEIDLNLVNFGQPVTIASPTDAWTYYTSKPFQLTAGYPSDWSTGHDSGGDTITSPSGDWLWLESQTGYAGADLTKVASEHAGTVQQVWAKSGYTLASADSVAQSVGNAPARITYMTDATNHASIVDCLVLSGDRIYVIQYGALTDLNDDVRNFVEQFLTTVQLSS